MIEVGLRLKLVALGIISEDEDIPACFILQAE